MEERESLSRHENALAEDQASFRCNGCNGTFKKPLLATVSASGYVQKYYACPRCLSRISDMEHDESDEKEETITLTEKAKKVAVEKHEDSVKCEHFLGYLKKRSKNAPIPDECLTCDKMIECMIH